MLIQTNVTVWSRQDNLCMLPYGHTRKVWIYIDFNYVYTLSIQAMNIAVLNSVRNTYTCTIDAKLSEVEIHYSLNFQWNYH